MITVLLHLLFFLSYSYSKPWIRRAHNTSFGIVSFHAKSKLLPHTDTQLLHMDILAFYLAIYLSDS